MKVRTILTRMFFKNPEASVLDSIVFFFLWTRGDGELTSDVGSASREAGRLRICLRIPRGQGADERTKLKLGA